MIARLGASFSRWAERVVPDPFVFALLLTVLTFLLGWILTPSGPLEMVDAWGRGFWTLLEFAMQMCLILVTGHTLAHTRPARALVDRIADLPRNGAQAAGLVALVACLAALLNWGLGLILGALAAREVGRRARERGVPLHYPVLGAAGYTGLLVWHGGLSGSAPLAVATPGHVFADQIASLGWPDGLVPFGVTVFAGRNLLATGGVVAIAVLLCMFLMPRREEDMRPAPEMVTPLPSAEPDADTGQRSLARRLEASFLPVLPVALAGLAYSVWGLVRSGGQPNLNTINLTFLSVGLLLHGSAGAYVRAVTDAVRGIAGIVLQFPFYAGIMGMMRFSGAPAGPSLVQVLAGAAANISTPGTLPAVTLLSAAVVNLFVTSGGGQWAVQGPVLLEAAGGMDAYVPDLVLALSWGDQLTNMLQPFWAIPLLGITGLRAREIMGYTAVLMLFAGAWLLLCSLI